MSDPNFYQKDVDFKDEFIRLSEQATRRFIEPSLSYVKSSDLPQGIPTVDKKSL